MKIDCAAQTTKVLRRPRLKTSKTRYENFPVCNWMNLEVSRTKRRQEQPSRPGPASLQDGERRARASDTPLCCFVILTQSEPNSLTCSSSKIPSNEKKIPLRASSVLQTSSQSSHSGLDYSGSSSYDNASSQAPTPPPVSLSGNPEAPSFLQPAIFSAQYLQSTPPQHEPSPYPTAIFHQHGDYASPPQFDYSSSVPSQPGLGLTWKLAEQALGSFKLNYMPNFPFVAVGPHVSAQQLYCEKPLVFRTIMLASGALSSSQWRDIRRSINAYIGQHILVLEERSLDLLQGLLIFLAWSSGCDQDQNVTMLLHLAIGYAHSLGITRIPSPTSPDGPGTLVHGDTDIGSIPTFGPAYWRSLEEKRAFLGLYYLLSA
jgi:hypothetical protein